MKKPKVEVKERTKRVVVLEMTERQARAVMGLLNVAGHINEKVGDALDNVWSELNDALGESKSEGYRFHVPLDENGYTEPKD